MTKTEFIEELRRSLYGKVDDNELAGNVSYYSAYIDSEVASGRSEDEVVKELGEPRLIAKTIVETYKMKDDPTRKQYVNEEPDCEEEPLFDGGKLKKYIILALVLIVAFAILSFIFRIILALVPVILVAVIIAVIVKAIK